MLDKNRKWIIISSLLLAMLATVSGGRINAQEESGPLMVRPKVVYHSKGRRDPFVQPRVNNTHHVLGQVDIESLKLTGIIRNPTQATALFTTQTGPRFGYLLKNGKLYRENHLPVTGISGEIINPKQVILRQDDRQIIFKLR